MTVPEGRTVSEAGTRVLVVEDDASACTGLTELLQAWGYETTGAVDGEDAIAKVKADQPDIVLADLVMPRRDGLSLLRELKDRLGELSFVMITAQGTVDSAVSAMKEGAYDYLTKPIDPQRLRVLLERVVERHDSRREMAALRRQLVDGARFGRMIGASPAILEVYNMVEQAAPSEATHRADRRVGAPPGLQRGDGRPMTADDRDLTGRPMTETPHASLFLPQDDGSTDAEDPSRELAFESEVTVSGESGQVVESSVAPAAPTTIAQTGLSSDNILALTLKTLYTGELSGIELSEAVRIAYAILKPVIEAARVEQLIEVRSASGSGTAGYRYAITNRGRERALQYFETNGYVGAAPVPLDQYARYVNELGKHNSIIDREVIASGFTDLIVSDDMLDQLGPAVSTRRAMFLYGPPGNGKSAMSAGIGRALGGSI